MHEKKGIKIIYEDDLIIVVDKPSGILVTPDFKGHIPTLTDLLNKELSARGENLHAYPCHRLDRDTTGLVVFSKTKKSQEAILEQFKLRRVKKRYLALVHGKLERRKDTIRSYVSSSFRFADKNFRKSPKLAVTSYRLIKAGKDFSLVEVFPLTGRTNQIRIQFKQIGHPLLGERKYAFGKDFALKFRRVALHAADIEFRHPETNENLYFSAGLPEDMSDFVNSKLRGLNLFAGEKNVFARGSV